MLTSPYGKSYIGQTVRPIEERLKEHQLPSSGCVAIYGAIQKHGWDNFEKHWYEVPDEELNAHEELMVEVLGTLAPGGYNLMEGGGSRGKPCEESREKMSKAKKGKTLTDDQKKKLRDSIIGTTHTDDHKQKISESLLGEKNHKSKTVYQYDLDGMFVQSFASCGEAARSLNTKHSNSISWCANGKRKSAYGFKWSYTKL